MVIWKNKSRTLLRNGKELVEKGAYMLDLLLRKYRKRFSEGFPLFYFRNRDESEIEQEIREALDNGKPYEPPGMDDTDIDY